MTTFEIQNGILVVDFWLPADLPTTKLTINGDQGIEIKEVINEKLNSGQIMLTTLKLINLMMAKNTPLH